MHVEPEKPNVTKAGPAVGFVRNRKSLVSIAKYRHRSRSCFLRCFLQYWLDAQAYFRQDRTLLQILDRLGRVETLLDTLNSRGETQTHRTESPDRTTAKSTTQTPPTPTAPTASRPTPVETPLDDDEQLTIPYQHTTAAHKLLQWPSIRKLIDQELLEQETYAIDEEQNRGTLRVYGRGEEYNSGDPNFEESDYSCSITANWSMLYNTAGNEWDGGGGEGNRGEDGILEDQGMPDRNGEINSGLPDCDVGGLGPHGVLRLDRQTVQELLNSYLANIHILHPILDKATITHMVFRFADLFNSQGNGPSHGLGLGNDTNGSGTSSPQMHRNNSMTGKRKRGVSIPHQFQVPPPAGHGNIPRTVHSALVLLVLALGAVCLHRRPIPGPLPRAEYSSDFSDPTSPFRPSTTPPYSSDVPPYQQQRYHQQYSRGTNKPGLRNVDVIPGLAYFAQAMDILGLLVGSNELENVQAGLLAGLYWAQLARILDSWKWISQACMGCQILIRMFVHPFFVHTLTNTSSPGCLLRTNAYDAL